MEQMPALERNLVHGGWREGGGNVQYAEGETDGDGELFFALHVKAHDYVPGEDGEDKVHGCGPGWRRLVCDLWCER